MRNLLLTVLAMFVMVQYVSAQQVARDHVVVEAATGFW
jgi:hypothetical protein